jgi:hypothetical protein
MTKNLSFLHFRAIFMSYCSQFWVFGVIFKAHDTWYLFDEHDQKFVVFAFMAFFRAIALCFGVCEVIYKAHDTH